MADSWAAQFTSSGSNFSFHAGPTSLHVIASAASRRLENFLRRRTDRGFFLPSSSFHPKCAQHTSYLGHLRDSCLERAITHLGSNKLHRSNNATRGTFLSLHFSGGEGSENTSSHGEKSSSQFFAWKIKCTDILVGVNVAVYAAEIVSRGIKYLIGGKLLSCSAKINSQIGKGEVWRLVTSPFMHTNFVHFWTSFLTLRTVGSDVEECCGPLRFLTVYFTSAITSSAMSYWLCKSPSVGATGAIFGLMGAETVFNSRHKEEIVDISLMVDIPDRHRENIKTVLGITAILKYYVKGIDFSGLIGGFLGGVASSWLLGPSLKPYISPEGKKYYVDKPPISAVLDLIKPT